LKYATNDYGDIPLRELERMVDELAGWQSRLPERSRYGIAGALRQTLGAAVHGRRKGVRGERRTVSDGEVVTVFGLLFPGPAGGVLRLDNFRRRE